MLFLSLRGTAVPLVFCLVLQVVTAGYVITFPRKWVTGARTQICLALDSPPGPNDGVTLEVVGEWSNGGEFIGGPLDGLPLGGLQVALRGELRGLAVLHPVFGIPFEFDEAPLLFCEDFDVPDGLTTNPYGGSYIKVRVKGGVSGVNISETMQVVVIQPIAKVILQTDKSIYKGGQTVQFRLLTLKGVYIDVSTDPYPEIFVESPSGSRIAQWLNVPNPSGLIHRELQLIDEPEEGTYKIVVRASGDTNDASQFFRVEDYVLPRFEVTFTPPPYFLASDDFLELDVCARYTFGQPVRGNVSINIARSYYYDEKPEINFIDELVGCGAFKIPVSSLDINNPRSLSWSMLVTVVVEEKGTGVTTQETAYIYIDRTVLRFMHVDNMKYVKPDLPFQYTINIQFPNSQPAAYEPMTACYGSVCRNFTTDESGILRVVCPPSVSDTSSSIEVRSVNYPDIAHNSSVQPYMYWSRGSFSAQNYYSPSKSSLLIRSDARSLTCTYGDGIIVKAPVLYAAQGVTQANLYVQVVSRGQIQFWKSYVVQFTPTDLPFDESELLGPIQAPASSSTIRGAFRLTLELPPTVSTTAHVLIWYTRPDGEVVSDEQVLQIDQCLNYAVELSWSTKSAEQGTEVPLTLAAEPNSLCSLGVVDKSVELLAAPQSSVLQEIFQLVDQANVYNWEMSQINDYEYCMSATSEPQPGKQPPLPPLMPGIGILNSIKRKDETPNQRLSMIYPGYHLYSNMVDAIKMFDQAGVYVLSDQTLETRPCIRDSYGYNYMLSAVAGGPDIGGGDAMVASLMGGNMESGVPPPNIAGFAAATPDSETRVYFPETWLWELYVIPDTGVYSDDVTLPDTITEWVGSAVCVHPQKGVGISTPTSIKSVKSFFIDLTLPPSVKVGEILPVKISVFNYYNTSLPVRVTLEQSSEYEILGASGREAAADQAAAGVRSACVPSGDKETVVVRIRPLVAGAVAINVTAVVDATYPQPCGSSADPGITDRISKPIDVDYEGFPREIAWTKFICSTDVNKTTWYLEAPAGIVNNSVRAWVTMGGDLLGPTLDNLGHLIQMPYGCGEQNMVSFTPNIYVLQYLQATNQDTAEVTQRLLTYIKSGYLRELTYKRYDGSYSCFGNGDQSGSTWLTAFVLKSYAQSALYIDVDPDEIINSGSFLKDLQLSNGCFKNVGTVHNKRMKGGVGDSDTPGPLTAYVMAALLEAGVSPSAAVIVNATACVDAATAAQDDVYLLALKAYAYSLASLSQTEAIINDLLSRATQTAEGIYWDMNSLNGLYSDGLSVETASYVLLAMLTANVPDPQGKVLRIVKWISSRRNGQGGFVSTQDTVVALQALALFGEIQGDEPLNLTVTITGDDLNAVFQVTESNRLLSQRSDVDVVPNEVTADVAGSGCALVQAVVRYNVPDPDVSEVFSLNVGTYSDYSSTRCPAYVISVCATYLLNDGESNMGIIEVNLVSGYVPKIEDLERIVADVTGAIKRYEVDNGKVQLYIDQFTDTESCVQFTAFQETEVEDVKPGTVKIYDYYEPDFFISKTFTFGEAWWCR